MLGKTRDIVLAADTTVVVGGEMFGKPRDRPDAARMLHSLSDTVHEVLTGVVVLAGDREDQQIVRTRVHFLPLSSDDIDAYIRSGEPDGKGGRLRHSGSRGALHRLDRRLLVQRGGVTGSLAGGSGVTLSCLARSAPCFRSA